MATSGTTWVDLTDLIGWQGNFTGIQRVVYNVALRYAADPTTKFFVMRSSLSRVAFEEVAFDSVRPAPAAASQAVAASTGRAKAIAKRIAAHVPYARTLARHLRRQTTAPQTQVRAIEGPFAGGDTVIVLGGNWGSTDYLPAIASLRKRVGFRFYHVVYDLVAIYTRYIPPEVFALFRDYLKHIIQAADGIIAISESTKRDCLRFMKDYDLQPIPVGIMRLGDESAKAGDGGAKSPNPKLKPGKFILCVSTIEIRKNHTLLFYAARLAREKGIELPPIVLVGKMGWLAGDIQFLFQHDPVAKEQFIVTQGIGDAELEWLYRNCSFTVYPSFYEGWGLPIAESLVYGKPCLSADTSSMPEVGGDLVDYFSPYDSGQCLDQIVRYLDPATLARKTKAIKDSYHPRSWDDAYTDVQQFISQV